MGIKDLNKVLKNQCKNSIKIMHLSELSEKIIVIDASIYLYRYASDNTLIENMFLMMSIFYSYNITPIFIFDGKPPPEKKDLLIKRIQFKREAEKEFDKLKHQLDNENNLNLVKKKDIVLNMNVLKKQFVYLKKEETDKVKQLIGSYGATYIEAPGEADELCAMLVLKNKVWACLSEDTDLFVYGCTRVLRYLSLLNHSVVLYDMENILFELGLTQSQFREICVLSGTDYNSKLSNNYCLEKLLDLYKKYLSLSYNNLTFYEWIETDSCIFQKINNIFDLTENKCDLTTFVKENDFQNKVGENRCYKKMREILEEDGFLFTK
jgi:flap endonuclease-1